MIRRLCLMGLILTLLTISITVNGSTLPYSGYNYDYWGDATPSPAAYKPIKSLSGIDLGVGMFKQASDLFVTSEHIYLVDSGNNRIVVFDHQWRFEEEIKEFLNEEILDTFLNPTGIYVTKDESIYVADRDHHRVLVFNQDREVIYELKDPASESFTSDFEFIPEKVAVDYAGRIYVVANGIFEGIMSFDEKGDFYGYQGTIVVSISPADIIWRALSTRAQREKQILYIPTEFTNLDMDDGGFIYTTNVDIDSDETIKRLNPMGKDVLRRPERATVDGDQFYAPPMMNYGGPSGFVDIDVRNDGMYSVLDKQRGRIFTYGHEGDLLYIFGTVGNQLGSFKKPIAIESLGSQLMVLDQERGEVVLFESTTYGDLINKAIALRYRGDEKKAVDLWLDVLDLNANFELAYVGIGKSLLSNGHNKEAMDYFEYGMDQKYYSIAFKRYRNEVLKDNLGSILTVLMLVMVVFIGFRRVKKKKGVIYND